MKPFFFYIFCIAISFVFLTFFNERTTWLKYPPALSRYHWCMQILGRSLSPTYIWAECYLAGWNFSLPFIPCKEEDEGATLVTRNRSWLSSQSSISNVKVGPLESPKSSPIKKRYKNLPTKNIRENPKSSSSFPFNIVWISINLRSSWSHKTCHIFLR